MASTVKVLELMAESDLSWEDATMVALEQARKTLRHIRSIDVGNFVALVADGAIKTYQISAKISFNLEPDEFEPRLGSSTNTGSLPVTLESPIAEYQWAYRVRRRG
jgi:flavin-binding protein dodecin